MDSHTTGPGFKPQWYGTLSIELLTDYHHNSIIKLNVRCHGVCGRSGKDFPIWTDPRHFNQ